MEVISHYESTVVQYENSHEMTEHIKRMEKIGWKCTSLSYGNLRARYRMDCGEEGENMIGKYELRWEKGFAFGSVSIKADNDEQAIQIALEEIEEEKYDAYSLVWTGRRTIKI